MADADGRVGGVPALMEIQDNDVDMRIPAAFDAALDGLGNALSGATVLPPLSEPSGNGKAYEKFLAIYNDLYGVATGGEELNEIEPVASE